MYLTGLSIIYILYCTAVTDITSTFVLYTEYRYVVNLRAYWILIDWQIQVGFVTSWTVLLFAWCVHLYQSRYCCINPSLQGINIV